MQSRYAKRNQTTSSLEDLSLAETADLLSALASRNLDRLDLYDSAMAEAPAGTKGRRALALWDELCMLRIHLDTEIHEALDQLDEILLVLEHDETAPGDVIEVLASLLEDEASTLSSEGWLLRQALAAPALR